MEFRPFPVSCDILPRNTVLSVLPVEKSKFWTIPKANEIIGRLGLIPLATYWRKAKGPTSTLPAPIKLLLILDNFKDKFIYLPMLQEECRRDWIGGLFSACSE